MLMSYGIGKKQQHNYKRQSFLERVETLILG